ncbi:hypothetical protein [Archangium sp.]|uniref:hypothetical protein n=1 Tax=Archangium sp. TaxID=1872627 RepID=UPI00389A3342
MDYYEDVLDRTGRTPREFGAIHLHVESAIRGPLGDTVATLWLQSAFEPLASGYTLHVEGRQKTGPEKRKLGKFSLPPLDGGKVVRWSLPFSLPLELDELHFRVEAKLHPKAERVRTAWKLSDTVEIPKESDMAGPKPPPVGINLGRSLMGSVLSGGLFVSFRGLGGRDSPGLASTVRTKVHAAAKLPDVVVVPVFDGSPEELSKPHEELIWKPGMPLPQATLTPNAQDVLSQRPPESPRRTCHSCGFEGRRSDYAYATMCPMCDASWL